MPTSSNAASAPSTRALRVLVVDDHEDACDLYRELLERDGHEVVCATDGATAMVRAGESAFDAAIVDIGLPDIDGYSLAAELRKSAAGESKMLLVAVTGHARDEDRARALAAGFDAHLAKPLEIKALTRLLDNHPAP